jgi:hypothetical protein
LANPEPTHWAPVVLTTFTRQPIFGIFWIIEKLYGQSREPTNFRDESLNFLLLNKLNEQPTKPSLMM